MWVKRTNYLFLLPAVIWFFVFCYIPMAGLIIVFKDYSIGAGIWGSKFSVPIGKYFLQFFDNPLLKEMIVNTVVLSLLKLVTAFPAPIVLAILLNEMRLKKFKSFVQTVSYFPFFISWIIVVTMLDQLLTPFGAGGPLYKVLEIFRSGGGTAYYMVDKKYFYAVALLSNVWKSIGWNSIIYLAAITAINPELYEAAKIDGAGRMRSIFAITLPGISNTIGLLFILALGSLTSAGYEQVYLLQQPANYEYSNVLDVYIINTGLNSGKYSLSAVGGLFQGVFSLILITAGNFVLKKTSNISLW